MLKTGTRTIDGAVPADYDGPFIPGGLAPGELRTNDLALDFVKGFAETGREHLSRTARIRYLLGRVEEEVAKLAAHVPETIRVKEAELGAEERRLGTSWTSSALAKVLLETERGDKVLREELEGLRRSRRKVFQVPPPEARLQTDRGGEFFALSFQATLRAYAIKFRPIPPRSPHLNGKVERFQQTDWVEFYATADLADPDLPLRLEEWQFFYNWRRPRWRSSRSTVNSTCDRLSARSQVSISHTRSVKPVIAAHHPERTEAMHNLKKLILSVSILTFGFATATHAQQVTTLLAKQLPEAPGKEIEVITVNYAPGAVDAMHRHDAHAVVYVLEGEVEMQVRGGTLQRLGPGQVFYESPEDVHTVSRNASKTKPAKFVVFFVKNEGAPILTPVH